MTEEEILKAKTITLKPNAYLKDENLPYLYQRRGILMMLVRQRALCGDDVGLGKTLEAIVTYTYLKSRKPNLKALVFTEIIALDQWLKEVDWLTKGISARIITAETHPDTNQRARAFRESEADIIITTYSMLYNYRRYLIQGRLPNYIVIADEPNYFKNPSTVMHKNIREVTVAAERAYGLTATIVENRLEEALGILHGIAPGVGMSFYRFHKHHCIRKRIKKNVVITVGYKNIQEFKNYIHNYWYGRLQDNPEVLQQLPDVITKDIELRMTKEQSKVVLEAMDGIMQLPTGEVTQMNQLVSLIRAQQLVNDPELLDFDIPSVKENALMEALKGSLASQRVVVFTRFRSGVDLIGKRLSKEGLDYVRITGAESHAARKLAKTRFMSDGLDRVNIMLMNKAGHKAVELQKSGHLWFYDIPWSYGTYRQVIGRLKRTGSKFKHIGVYRCLATLHEDVAAIAGTNKTIDHYALSVCLRCRSRSISTFDKFRPASFFSVAVCHTRALSTRITQSSSSSQDPFEPFQLLR